MPEYLSDELIDCDGVRLWVRSIDGNQSMDHLLVHEHFSRALHPAIDNLPKEAVVLDGGAHIGIYSFMLLRHRPDFHIIAVEPEPCNFGYLFKNKNENSAHYLYPLQYALADKRMIIKLHNIGNSGAWTTKPRSNPYADFTAYAVTVEDILVKSPYDHFDLIKLDIEGLEWEVLSTMSLTLLDQVQVFDIDLHANEKDVKTLLRSNGFTVENKLNWVTGTPSGVMAYRDN